MNRIYRAKTLNPVCDNRTEVLEDAAVFVKDGGIIRVVPWNQEIFDFAIRNQIEIQELRSKDKKLMLLLPGFCDLHFHWVQDLVSDMEKNHLLDWLEKYVFPEESRFSNSEYCKVRSDAFFEKLFRCGTLAGAMYSSIHEKSSLCAFEKAKGWFKVGNVVMTDNSPSSLLQNLDDAMRITENLGRALGDQYLVTPRFAISCRPEVLKALGDFSVRNGHWVQTHLSETEAEIEYTLSFCRQFPGFETVDSYLEIYDRCGLIHERTILGHCIHLQQKEKEVIARKKAIIAHCPTSNAPISMRGLGSGLFDWKGADMAGMHWALASDIGAGPYLSMLDVMRSFLEQNQIAGVEVTALQAFYRATRKGFELLGIPAGAIEIGKRAAFVLFEDETDFVEPEKILKSLFNRKRTELNTLAKGVILEDHFEIFI